MENTDAAGIVEGLSKGDALDQSLALNRIVMQLLKTRANECKRLWVALIVSILANLAIVGSFLWFESSWVYSDEVTTEIEQETEDGGNNFANVGDRYYYGDTEEEEYGTADSKDNSSQNKE